MHDPERPQGPEPVGYLVLADPDPDRRTRCHPLRTGRQTIGRDCACNIVLPRELDSVSRIHAAITIGEGGIFLEDQDSSRGTFVDGVRLKPGAVKPLQHGSRVGLADVTMLVLTMDGPDQDWRRLAQADVLGAFGQMSSLDIRVVVSKTLELVRKIADVEESYLVTTPQRWLWPMAQVGDDLRDLGSMLDDPSLRVSRSVVEEALASGLPVTRFLEPKQDPSPRTSIFDLGLFRIWAHPIMGGDGRPIAVLYLQSRVVGDAFDSSTESILAAIAAQLGLLIRNAWLHQEIVVANETLEERVSLRTLELEQSRARLVRQDRMATLGRLVAGIAHELNNPAGAVLSLAQTQTRLLPVVCLSGSATQMVDIHAQERYAAFLVRLITATTGTMPDTRLAREREALFADLLRAQHAPAADRLARTLARSGFVEDDLDSESELLAKMTPVQAESVEAIAGFARSARTIADAAQAIARIVQGLKQYSHLDQAEVVQENVNRSVQLTLEIMRSRIPSDIEVITDLAATERIPHRPGEISQVWTNLVDNAIRAMGEKGTLTIRTRPDGEGIRIEIEDTGPGISPQLGERIFELDVTTRGPGAGLGLGLPICRVIVEEKHGGRLTFASRPGCTVFTVWLPLRHAPLPEQDVAEGEEQ